MCVCSISRTRAWLLSLSLGGGCFDVSKQSPRGAALIQANKGAHFQCTVWYNDTVANPNIPSPSEYEWREEAGGFSPIMTTIDPAPESILQ